MQEHADDPLSGGQARCQSWTFCAQRTDHQRPLQVEITSRECYRQVMRFWKSPLGGMSVGWIPNIIRQQPVQLDSSASPAPLLVGARCRRQQSLTVVGSGGRIHSISGPSSVMLATWHRRLSLRRKKCPGARLPGAGHSFGNMGAFSDGS